MSEENSLYDRWYKLENLIDSSKKAKVSIDVQDVRKKQIKMVRRYIDNDDIAKKVLEGETTYVELLKPAMEKYASQIKNVFKPDLDEDFDQQIKDVMRSMYDVGTAFTFREKEEYILYLTTEYIRNEYAKSDKKSIPSSIGGVVLTGASVAVSFAFIPLAIFALAVHPLARSWKSTNLKMNLSNLKYSAKRSDKFIQTLKNKHGKYII